MVYLIILLALIVLSINYDFRGNLVYKANKPYMFMCICFILLAGLRFFVGSDTHNYVYDFSVMPDLSKLSEFHRLNSRYQFGWDAYVCIIKSIFGNFVFVQLITAIIVNVIIFWFVRRNTTNVFIALLCYYILNYFEYNMEIMREAIAVALGLIAIMLYSKGYRKYFLLLVFVAFEIHISAIILLIVPFLVKVKYSKKKIIVISLLSIIVPVLFSQISGLTEIVSLFTASDPEYLSRYINQSLDDTRNIFYYLFLFVSYLVIPIICMFFLKEKTKYVGFTMAFIILRCLGMFTYAFYRFGNYFEPFYWILLADAIYIYWKKIQMPKLLITGVFTLCILYIYQRNQMGEYYMYPGHKLYERYIPYEMVNTTDHNYSINRSQYYFRNGTH